MYNKIHSELDPSVNFIKTVDIGKIEARYVERGEKVIAYISSQTGCDQACKMCHLTATGQNVMRDVTLDEITEQARLIVSHLNDLGKRYARFHFNFMARGEPLNNETIRAHWSEVGRVLHELIPSSKTLISTIMPNGVDINKIFNECYPEIYYSIYSVDPQVRKKWLPRAMPVRDALCQLASYQTRTLVQPRLHFAFIEGINDSVESVEGILREVDKTSLYPAFNIVRYNPYSEKYGKEPPIEAIEHLMEVISSYYPVKMVDKVGFDVKASCGMFVK